MRFVLAFFSVVAISFFATAGFADDASTEAALQATLEEIKPYKSVNVSVRAGVVSLEGDVSLDPTSEKELVALVKGFDGVRFVQNDIDSTAGLVDRLSPATSNVREKMSKFFDNVPLYLFSIFVFGFFWFIAGWLSKKVVNVLPATKNQTLIHGFTRQFVRFVVIGLGIVVVLELLNVTALVGALLGGAGVVGLAVGFALRDIVENYIAGILLSLRRPFEKNDFVKIQDYTGKVVRLTTRDAVLMTSEGNHLRIPNSVVFKSVINNYTRNPKRRFDFTIKVAATEDLDHALSVGHHALEEQSETLDKPKPLGLLVDLNDAVATLHFFAWIDQTESDFSSAKSNGIRAIKSAFEGHSVVVPAPQSRVTQVPYAAPKPHHHDHQHDHPVASEIQTDVDAQIDEQIEKDRSTSHEVDLLDE